MIQYTVLNEKSVSCVLRRPMAVAPSDLPTSTPVLECFVEQVETYRKNGFHLEILRRFKGSHVVDLETAMDRDPI